MHNSIQAKANVKMITGKKRLFDVKGKHKLFLMALPFLVLVFLFSYLPLYGWIYAFYNFRPGIPLAQTDFVGLQWFKSIFSNPTQTGEVLRVMRNTIAMSSLNIAASVLPVIFAIFLSEMRSARFKKSVQILTTLPNFISWVLVYSFAFMLFSVDNGLVNQILINLGLIDLGINFLASDSYTWLKMALWDLWKGLGWGAILYMAAIAGIDQELYEAAKVDGASRFRSIWHITVPGILPTYFVLLLLTIANFINNGLDQYFVFQNAINKDQIEVLDLYVYNVGMIGSNFSFATAVSMLKSFISVGLLFFANSLSKIVRGESII
ncbi:ABC transporter permease subunit [Paenibacillus sp. LHD-38]|uniref:ABC transporter permease n=1 Tax=Paenibacillus sp. LHD-38 TaxID=3072143 RepID=UPI00280CF35F|nr:ABC transporter permease subunit [Paenibacillus sp. LHD-38]MDQ8738985.1 ABC transporter permease subunit [Paenibacillus sp. LHD-38]